MDVRYPVDMDAIVHVVAVVEDVVWAVKKEE